MKEKIIVFGTDTYAQIVHTFFAEASNFEVVAFTVHRSHRKQDSLFDLPVVEFENVLTMYPPETYKMYVAVAQSRLNKVRARVYKEAKALGYELVSYVYPGVKIWSNVTIGDNCFIFDGCTINPFVSIGNNVIVWQGCVIGHHSNIGNHVFMAGPSVVASGVEVGDYSFLGINSAVRDGVSIGEECMIGAGSLIMRNAKPRQVYAAERARPAKQDTFQFLGLEAE